MKRPPVGERGEAAADQRRVALVDGWSDFLQRYAWDWFATFTFPDRVHPEAADKLFRVWVSKLNRSLYGPRWAKKGQGVYWIRALEWQRRGVVHYHALLGDVTNLNHAARRLEWMDTWYELSGGFARIVQPDGDRALTDYCGKYTAKGGEIDISPLLASYARMQGLSE